MRKRHILACAAMAALLPLCASFAQETKAPPRDRADAAESQLPPFLKNLDLTAEQEQQIRQVMRQHDARVRDVLEKFHRTHWDTVEFEAGLKASHELAGHDHSAHHDKPEATEPKDSGEARDGRERSDRPRDGVDRNRTDRGPKSNADDSRGTARRNESRNDENRDSAGKREGKAQHSDDDTKIVSLRIAVLKPNGSVREVVIAGNARAADECEICAAHAKQLGESWKQLQDLHQQLVTIEAERIVAVESKLTQEQVDELAKQAADEQPRDATSSDRPTSRAQPDREIRNRKE